MLTVDCRNCTKEIDEPSRHSLGINLLDIGIPELTDKNMNEALCRPRFACTLLAIQSEYPRLKQLFLDGVGVKVNVPPKTWAQFVSSHAKYFRSLYGPR